MNIRQSGDDRKILWIHGFFLLLLVVLTTSTTQAANVSGIRKTKTTPAYNATTQTYDSFITLTNTRNKPIQGPLALLVKGLKPDVTVVAPSGQIGKNAYLYVPLPSGVIAPKQTVGGIVIRFNNPKQRKISFSYAVITGLAEAKPIAPNHIPVANAGPDMQVTVDEQLQLDASASTDSDGNPLSYQWTLTQKPDNSNATLTNADQVHPALYIDQPGQYKAQLVVNDGQVNSFPDTLTLDTEPLPPFANAGPQASGKKGSKLTLDGSASFGWLSNTLDYQWSLLLKPSGSKVKLTDPQTVNPSLTLDKNGNYTVQLIVKDGILTSVPSIVTLSTLNSLPIANAGPDQIDLPLNQPVTLTSAGSSDPDGENLTRLWSLIYKPAGSNAQLSATQTVTTELTPDVVGDYIAQLIVNDGHFNSDPDTVQISSVGVVKISVPNLVGITEAEARSAITNAGLAVGAVSYSNSDTVNAGLVISQTPNAAAKASAGNTVDLVLSLGPSIVEIAVPNLLGSTAAAASDALGNAGLTVGSISYSYSDTVIAGLVISQSPQAGAIVNANSAVDLMVSQGPVPLPSDPATVAPQQDQTVTTSVASSTAFLYSGNNPIQTGVQPGTIEVKRAAVIRGKVLDKQNNPLPGVSISIANHSELGQTLSRADGQFDLAVNGGGLLTVEYRKTGYLYSQRQVDTPWQGWVVVDDVVLIQADSKVTTVDLAQASQAFSVAAASTVTDQDGSRTASLLIPQGTQASVINPDGSTVAVSQLHLSMTEFTQGANGPKAMPGTLPPTSGYTYAVEFTVAEAIAKVDGKDLIFSQPVPFYLDNFLNMPIGIPVPAGYYDDVKSAWIPAPDGRVIKILAVNNGIAEVDTDGDNLADDGAPIGMTSEERQQLGQLHPAGKSLWRISLEHLSRYDFNYGTSAKPGSIDPKMPPPKSSDTTPPRDCCNTVSSIIEDESQVLGETVAITGTPFSLNYRSDRVLGRTAGLHINIPLTEATVPLDLQAVSLEILVAGQRFKFEYGVDGVPVEANLSQNFTWDGKDAFGQTVLGDTVAKIRIGYAYPGVYNRPGGAVAVGAAAANAPFLGAAVGAAVPQPASFGTNTGVPIPDLVPTRFPVYLWQEHTVTMRNMDQRQTGLGAWMLNQHHLYDPNSRLLLKGDGSRHDGVSAIANSAINEVPNVPGSLDVASAPDGSVYFLDCQATPEDPCGSRIYKMKPNGDVVLFAGGGTGGDGSPANQAKLDRASGIALGPDGSLYIVDNVAERIRRVLPNGIITTFAGGGAGDDGSPAAQAKIYSPDDVAVAADGTVYFTERGALLGQDLDRIRRVSPDGIIHTVAGKLPPYDRYSVSPGDGGPASETFVPYINGIEIASDGNLIVSDLYGLRRITADGIINTYVHSANGAGAYYGHIDIDENGIVYSPFFYYGQPGSRVVMTLPDGQIVPLAGNGTHGEAVNGMPPLQVSLYYIRGVAVTQDGMVTYTADQGNARTIASSLPGIGLADYLIPSEDGSELYHFDSAGRHLETRIALTGAVRYSFGYDSSGRLTSITDGDGNKTSITHDAQGNPTSIIAPFGQVTQLAVDANGYLASVTDPAGQSHSLSYTADGLLTTFQRPNGTASTLTYDALGMLLTDTNAAGGSQSLSRSVLEGDAISSGWINTRVTGLGRATNYQVIKSSNGAQQRTVTGPDGIKTVTDYLPSNVAETQLADGSLLSETAHPDPRFGMMAPLSDSALSGNGLNQSRKHSRAVTLSNPSDMFSMTTQTDTITLGDGRVSTTTYNHASKAIATTSAAGRLKSSNIDDQGRILSTQMAGLLEINHSYDTNGRLVATTQGNSPDDRTVSYDYDNAGYLASITDPLGRAVAYEHDLAGRVTKQTLPDGRQILYSYDKNGNLSSLQPPGRPGHVFKYDAVDQKSEYDPPAVAGVSNGSTLYSYNLDKQLSSVTRPDGQVLSYNYDNGGRLSSLQLLPADISLNTFSYDAVTGKLTTVSDLDSGALNYSYNGPLTTEVSWSGAVLGSVGWSYDASNLRVTGVSVNGLDTISYGYDDDDLITAAGSLSLSRDAQNGLLTATSQGVVTDSMTYNGFGEITAYASLVNDSPVLNEEYSYDKLGRITQKVETVQNVAANTYNYQYDVAGRLTEVQKNGTVQAIYGYDDNGNRLSKTVSGVAINASYDDQDRLLSYGNTSYSYTANGELLSKTTGAATTQYQYDVLGNLRHVTLAGGTNIDYLIDGQNRRIGKKVGGVLQQGFLYQDQLKPIAELDGNNNVVSRFVYATHVNVPDYMIKGGVTYRIITDHLGSPRAVVNVDTGSVVQRMSYDEFGNVLSDSNPGFQPFGFAGGLYDRDTGLVRFGARDYDPVAGRWTSKDPIGFEGGLNQYTYVINNPTNLIDFLGLMSACSNTGSDTNTSLADLLKNDRNAVDIALNQLKKEEKFLNIMDSLETALTADPATAPREQSFNQLFLRSSDFENAIIKRADDRRLRELIIKGENPSDTIKQWLRGFINSNEQSGKSNRVWVGGIRG